MPIRCPILIRNLSPEEFNERDYIVMRCAFDSQNALGRLCEEGVYENDLARRLRAYGFSHVETQVPIVASHHSFSKTYRVDLIADHAVYELKTVSELIAEHFAQALNYATMLAINHVKLINFRKPSVEGMLKFNVILPETRRPLQVVDDGWRSITSDCEELKSRVLEVFDDWKGFIDFRLYEEALVHFFGGEDRVKRRVALSIDGIQLGSHGFCCHGDTTGFVMSGFADIEAQKKHVGKLLRLTELHSLQLLNLYRDTLTLHTLVRDE